MQFLPGAGCQLCSARFLVQVWFLFCRPPRDERLSQPEGDWVRTFIQLSLEPLKINRLNHYSTGTLFKNKNKTNFVLNLVFFFILARKNKIVHVSSYGMHME